MRKAWKISKEPRKEHWGRVLIGRVAPPRILTLMKITSRDGIWQVAFDLTIQGPFFHCSCPHRLLTSKPKKHQGSWKNGNKKKNKTRSRFLVWNRIVQGAFNGGTTRAVCPGGILTLSSSIRFSTGYIAALSRLKWCTGRGIGPGVFGRCDLWNTSKKMRFSIELSLPTNIYKSPQLGDVIGFNHLKWISYVFSCMCHSPSAGRIAQSMYSH